MKAGKSTDTLSQRLDTLAPGPAFDKAAAWDTLQQRLEKKKSRVIFPWKWGAAAAVLIATTLLLWPKEEKQTSYVNRASGEKNTSPVNPAELKKEKVIVNSNEQSAQTSPPANTAPASFTSIKKTLVTNTPVNEEITIPDSFSRIASLYQPELTVSPAPVPVKKKLRVVYNNDLAETDTEEMLSAPDEPGSENKIPVFRKVKLNNNLKAEKTFLEEITPRRKKGLPFFGPSLKPKY